MSGFPLAIRHCGAVRQRPQQNIAQHRSPQCKQQFLNQIVPDRKAPLGVLPAREVPLWVCIGGDGCKRMLRIGGCAPTRDALADEEVCK